MARKALTQVLETIKTLAPDELLQVQEAIQERLAPDRYSPEEKRFHQALLAAGLVKEIKPPRGTPSGARRLIQARGKPVSETLIEERR
jgi:hypothetical protein